MKRFLSILLILSMLLSCFALAACDSGEASGGGEETKGEKEENSMKVSSDLEAIWEAMCEKTDIDDKSSDTVYMADDEDRYMLEVNYDICDSEAAEKITDYFFTMPSDFCTSFAIFMFDEGLLSEDGIEEMKESVRVFYTESRASSLQMYVVDEYEHVTWALENEDITWRQYDNAIVFAINCDEGDTTENCESETIKLFEAFEAVALK